MFKIEKGIELPPKRSGRPATYPLKKMEVGDSFFVPAEKAEITKLQWRMSATISAHAKTKGNKGRKFSSRRVDG